MRVLLAVLKKSTPTETMNTVKSPLASRTIWIQILTLLSAFFPLVQEWISTNPVQVVSVFTSINVLVRFITKDKIKILGGSAGGVVNLVLGFFGLAALAFVSVGSLTSCSDYGVRGSVHLRDDQTGAKGGLEFVPGAPPLPFFRAPIRDASGSVIGSVDLRSGK